VRMCDDLEFEAWKILDLSRNPKAEGVERFKLATFKLSNHYSYDATLATFKISNPYSYDPTLQQSNSNPCSYDPTYQPSNLQTF